MTGAAPPVVCIRGLSHRYGKVSARSTRLELDIPAGCMVGLIGPDGVGKSTLLGLIAGREEDPERAPSQVLGGDMRSTPHPARRRPADRLHAAGAGQEPLPRAQRLRQRRLLGAAVRPAGRESARGRIDELLDSHRAGPVPRPPGRQALGRHEAEGRAVRRAGPRPGPADPRRAHHRRRSAVAAAVLGAHRRHPRRAARHERARLHRLHGRGAALRLARRPWTPAASWPRARRPS